jgi:Fic/DOC family
LVPGSRPLRIAPSAALKERRLSTLLGERPGQRALLTEQVLDAQLLGSLDLARLSFSWEEIKASRGEERPAFEPARALRRAQAAALAAPSLSVDVLVSWHAEVTGRSSALRKGPRERVGGPPTSSPEFVRSRLDSLVEWLSGDSGRELPAPQRGALGLARFVEIHPFDDANGRVSRLLASHLMTQAGARPPILLGADRERLDQCLGAAFQLVMEPLAMLLEEASERALDVELQTLEGC